MGNNIEKWPNAAAFAQDETVMRPFVAEAMRTSPDLPKATRFVYKTKGR